MKGWQNYYEIAQKLNRDDGYYQSIKHFENNEYEITQQIIDHIDFRFPQLECFSLDQLIEGLNYNFIKIYKGQLLIIILEVLKHLQQLHQLKISHGRLIPQNIVIKLKYDKTNKLTIIQTKFRIEQVYFINYSLIDDCNYQINYLQDLYNIIDCLIQIIQTFKNQQCQLLKLICNMLNDYKKNNKKNDLNKLVEFFNQLIQDCVNQDQQKLKKGKVNLSMNLNESTIQGVQYQEGEEFSFYQKRNIMEIFISNFIVNLNSQSLIYEFKFNKNQNNDDYDELIQQFDNSKLRQDELKIFNVVESIIKQQMMKIIWDQFGAFLESWDSNFDIKCNAILKEINSTNNQILNNQLRLLLGEFNNVNQMIKQIKEEIEKDYKFDINYDEQKAKDIFILELKTQTQNYSFNNFQSFIDTIKSNVKKDLQNYYKEILTMEILKLIFDLI